MQRGRCTFHIVWIAILFYLRQQRGEPRLIVANALEIGGAAVCTVDALQGRLHGALGNVLETLRDNRSSGEGDCKQRCETVTHVLRCVWSG